MTSGGVGLRTLAVPLLLAILLPGSPPARAAQGPTLWQVQGAHNTVFLFGSVHLLRPGDFALEGALAQAYEAAESLLLEVDTDDLTPARVETITLQRAVDKEGRVEPWFEALNVTTATLNQAGFTVDSGVEAQLQRQATLDGKRLGGLETLDAQLAALDTLSPEVQQDLLAKSRQDANRPLHELVQFVEAWKAGDQAYLDERLEAEFAAHREIYQALIVERNQRWVRRIVDLLAERDDYLIVVGALHLVGDDSLQSLLASAGYRAERLP